MRRREEEKKNGGWGWSGVGGGSQYMKHIHEELRSRASHSRLYRPHCAARDPLSLRAAYKRTLLTWSVRCSVAAGLVLSSGSPDVCICGGQSSFFLLDGAGGDYISAPRRRSPARHKSPRRAEQVPSGSEEMRKRERDRAGLTCVCTREGRTARTNHGGLQSAGAP